MTKTDLIGKVSKETSLTKAAVGRAFEAGIEAVVKALKKGDKVILVGFGTFSVSKRKARTGRNPRTGAILKIPAHKAPKFTAGKALKDAVK